MNGNGYGVVCVRPNGEKHYGVADVYTEEGREALAAGRVYVVDVRGTKHLFEQSEVEEIPFGPYRVVDGEGDWPVIDDEYAAHVRDRYLDAEDVDRSLPDDGELHVGAMFMRGVGEGVAYYVVTHIYGRDCMVEWRGFDPERYTDFWLGKGGRFDYDAVNKIVQAQRRGRRELERGKTNG